VEMYVGVTIVWRIWKPWEWCYFHKSKSWCGGRIYSTQAKTRV